MRFSPFGNPGQKNEFALMSLNCLFVPFVALFLLATHLLEGPALQLHQDLVPVQDPVAQSADTDSAAPATDSDPAGTVAAEPQRNLRSERIAQVLATYYVRQIDADRLRPWSIMHGLIAYGPDSRIIAGGHPVNAVEYLCNNGAGDGMTLMYLSNGQLKTRIGQGVQGHAGQLLAMLAQSGVPASYPLKVEDREFQVQDLIEYEQRGCRSGTELTFKLIALAHYLPPNSVWKNDLGETWDMQRLIREEMAQPVTTGACGGTHRLMSLTYAVWQLERTGQPLVGEWHNAARMLGAWQERAWKFQNADGSFSTEWFNGPGADLSLDKRLYTSGHTLEWLACSLPEEQLGDPRMTAAVDYLLELMLGAPGYELDVGPRGHALHALLVYQMRMFGEGLDYAALMSVSDVESIVKPKRIVATPASSQSLSGRQESGTGPAGGDRRAQPRGVFRRR